MSSPKELPKENIRHPDDFKPKEAEPIEVKKTEYELLSERLDAIEALLKK